MLQQLQTNLSVDRTDIPVISTLFACYEYKDIGTYYSYVQFFRDIGENGLLNILSNLEINNYRIKSTFLSSEDKEWHGGSFSEIDESSIATLYLKIRKRKINTDEIRSKAIRDGRRSIFSREFLKFAEVPDLECGFFSPR